MSALAGILDLRGERPSAAALERVFAPVRYRGDDHGSYHSKGGFALAVASFATTPEDVAAAQPLIERDVCLGFDGRIDNREELLDTLGQVAAGDRQESDARLVLRAFARWGDSFVERLVGDFALALWDDQRQRLLLARDVVGQRQLLYHVGPRVIVFGTEVAQILAHPDVSLEPNEAVVAEWLSADLRSERDTLYRNVHRLLPAHAMVVERGRVRTHRYWDIDPAARVRHRSEADYVEHFDQVFARVVRAQRRALGPLGAQLSGGLDSSAVLGAAVREGRASEVSAFSLVFPGLACDESAYIDRVVDRLGVESVRFEPASRPLEDPLDQAARYRDVPDYPNATMHAGLNRLAAERGCRVLLTGCGGDEFWSGSFEHAADLLAAGHVLQSAARCWWDSRTPSFVYPRFGFVRLAVAPLLSPRLYAAIRDGYRWLRPSRQKGELLGPALIGRSAQLAEPASLAGGTHAQREAYLELRNGWAAQGYESGTRFAAHCGVEERSPFIDRRLLELSFAMPEWVKRKRDDPKRIVRHALRDVLPADALARRTKADFSQVYDRSLGQFGPRLMNTAIARCGWVNPSTLARHYQRWRQDRFGALSLWMCLAIESWYQSVVA